MISSPTTAATCATSPVSNTASADSDNDGSDSDSDSIDVLCPVIDVTKTGSADSVSVGTGISFTITVANTGTGTAQGVDITDTLPTDAGLNWTIGTPTQGSCSVLAGVLTCNIGQLTPGQDESVVISSPTTAATCATSPVSNTASADSDNDGSDSDSDSIDVLCADLGITKVADADPINAGDTAGFVITVTNNGAGQAQGVDIDDVLPATSGIWVIDTDGPDATTAAGCAIVGDTLHCDQSDLAAGASVTVHVTSTTSSADCPTRTLNNTASTTSTNDGSAQASDSITINCPVLQITKTADADPINASDIAGFVITATNTGAGLAHGVDIDDALPATSGTRVIDTEAPTPPPRPAAPSSSTPCTATRTTWPPAPASACTSPQAPQRRTAER